MRTDWFDPFASGSQVSSMASTGRPTARRGRIFGWRLGRSPQQAKTGLAGAPTDAAKAPQRDPSQKTRRDFACRLSPQQQKLLGTPRLPLGCRLAHACKTAQAEILRLRSGFRLAARTPRERLKLSKSSLLATPGSRRETAFISINSIYT